uniref:Uncharacterized protein n=1 Tax=Rhizophora mucronata TaxID=61149 RepID=A0A2P2LNB1_RHIMU
MASINRVSPICCGIHAWVMRWRQSISVSIIELPSVVCSTPLIGKIESKLQNAKNKI